MLLKTFGFLRLLLTRRGSMIRKKRRRMVEPNIGRKSRDSARVTRSSNLSALKHGTTHWTRTTASNGSSVSACGSITRFGLLSSVGGSLGLPVFVAGISYSTQIVFHTLMMLHGKTSSHLEVWWSRLSLSRTNLWSQMRSSSPKCSPLASPTWETWKSSTWIHLTPSSGSSWSPSFCLRCRSCHSSGCLYSGGYTSLSSPGGSSKRSLRSSSLRATMTTKKEEVKTTMTTGPRSDDYK